MSLRVDRETKKEDKPKEEEKKSIKVDYGDIEERSVKVDFKEVPVKVPEN